MVGGKIVDIIGPVITNPSICAEFVANPLVSQTMPGITGLPAPVRDIVCVDNMYTKSCVIVEAW
jgi:hypothetical protein